MNGIIMSESMQATIFIIIGLSLFWAGYFIGRSDGRKYAKGLNSEKEVGK